MEVEPKNEAHRSASHLNLRRGRVHSCVYAGRRFVRSMSAAKTWGPLGCGKGKVKHVGAGLSVCQARAGRRTLELRGMGVLPMLQNRQA